MSENVKEKIVPENIEKKIKELKELETLLGHLPPDQWNIGELYRKTENSNNYQKNTVQQETRTEMLFVEICEDLFALNFDHIEIAQAINKQLHFSGGPKYCNESEVRDALELD